MGLIPLLFMTILLAGAFPAAAQELQLTGSFAQGGLVIGRIDPGARVALDGKDVRVSKEGMFLLGFGRDAAAAAELRLVLADGAESVQTLRITQREYKIQRIDGLPTKKVTPDPASVKRISIENAMIKKVRAVDTDRAYFASGFDWPVKGPISGVFGSQRVLNGKPKNPHNGVDVAAPQGTVIVAPADGVVALVHGDMFYTGKTVMIDHGHGLTSVYAHMSAILVKDGQKVARGTPIGKIGKTGRVTGPHLHWGVTLFGTHLDPRLLTGPMPKGN